MEESTVEACRGGEFYTPQLVDRNTYEQWADLGKPDLYSKAKQKVEEIIASPPVNPLPDKIIGKLEEIMRRADEELA